MVSVMFYKVNMVLGTRFSENYTFLRIEGQYPYSSQDLGKCSVLLYHSRKILEKKMFTILEPDYPGLNPSSITNFCVSVPSSYKMGIIIIIPTS